MTLFTDEAAVYGAFGKLFWDVIADEKARGALVRTNTILQLQLREPRSTVTVAVRQNQDSLVYFGPTTRRPEVFLQMDADTAHGWLVGEINPVVAFGDNRIKARGPNSQVLAILAWAKVLTPQYKAILEANGGELPPPLAPPEPPVAAESTDEPAGEPAPAEEAAEPVVPDESPASDTAEDAPEPEVDPAPAEETPEPAPAEESPASETPEDAPEPEADPAPSGETPEPSIDPAPEAEAPPA